MRIVHVSEHDIIGGAGKAALRLHQGLLAQGVDSILFVKRKHFSGNSIVTTDSVFDRTVRYTLTPYLDRLPVLGYKKRSKTDIFSNNWIGSGILKKILALDPDIVNLHWVNSTTLSLLEISKIKVPIVWTMHDMWSVTGGCHYDFGCNKYTDRCGACPILGSQYNTDVSTTSQALKRRLWQKKTFSIVTPSRWLKTVVEESKMFPNSEVLTIPYGLDLETFRPYVKADVQRILGLDPNRLYVLFGGAVGTTDRRKGYELLLDALNLVHQQLPDKEITLLTFGQDGVQDFHPEIPYPIKSLGHFSNEIPLSMIYVAADVFVLPTLQDNLPNTILEALASGTPTVAFNVGGVPDMITHKYNGYLAEPESVTDLANGLTYLLDDDAVRQACAENARTSAVEKFSLSLQAQRYKAVYQNILNTEAAAASHAR